MRGAGGEGFFEVCDVGDLGERGDVEGVWIGEAAGAAGFDGADGGRAGPGFVIHGAFLLADPADAVGKGESAGLNPAELRKRKGGKLGFNQGSVQKSHLGTIFYIILHDAPVCVNGGKTAKKSRPGRRRKWAEKAPGAVCGTPDAILPACAGEESMVYF